MMNYYRCEGCFYTVKSDEQNFEKLTTCPYCPGDFVKSERDLSLRSNLIEWENSNREGFFSMALGRAVASPESEERIMNDMGFVKESKLNKKHDHTNYVGYQMQLAYEREKEIARLTEIYLGALRSGKTQEEAVAEAFNTEDALSGKLIQLFNPTGDNNA